MPDVLADAASAGAGLLPAGGGPPQGAQAPPNLQQIQQLISNGTLSPQMAQHLLSFAAQPTQPQAPVRAATPQVGIPQGSFQSSGERGRAEKQALFGGIASIVKSGSDYLKDKQVQSMQMDTERLMSAQQGLSEAQASGDQAAIDHNNNILNHMLDPNTPEGKKRIKSFEKAFNVNLLGEHKDKDSAEYKGLVAAFKKFGDDKAAGKTAVNPIAQKLMEAMPQRQQINPEIQAQMAMIHGGMISSANANLKASTDFAKTLSTAQQAGFNRDNKIQLAKMLGDVKDKASQMRMKIALQQGVDKKNVAEIAARAVRYRADKMYDSVMNNPHWQALKDKASKDDKTLTNMINMTDKQLKDLQKSKAAAQKIMDNDDGWFNHEGAASVKKYADQIETVERQQQNIIAFYNARSSNPIPNMPTPDPEPPNPPPDEDKPDPDSDLDDDTVKEFYDIIGQQDKEETTD